MTMLPPPPPPSGRHPILRSPLPPPPDRRHPAHAELLEKPSVRPFLLEIDEDEFRAGHLMPKFPPAEALPRIVPEPPPPRRRRLLSTHLVHTLELAAVVAMFALVAFDQRSASSSASQPTTVIGHTLAIGEKIFPIEPTIKTFPIDPVIVTPEKPLPVKAAPVVVAPKAAAPVEKVVAPKAAPPAPKPEEAKPEAPPAPPEDPNGGVQDPGF